MSDLHHRPSAGLGVLTVVLTLVGWSSIPLFLKHFSHSIDFWTSNGWRYGFSALLWSPVLIIGLYRKRLPPGLWRSAIVPSIVNSAGQVCFTWAHYKIDPGLLTFGLRSQMVFVAVGAFILFPVERPIIRSPWYLAGAVAVLGGTTGAVILAGEPIAGAHAMGVLLAIGSGGLFAFYGLAVRRYMEGVNSVVAFAAISQYTAGVMVILMVTMGEDRGMGAWHLSNGQFVLLLLSALIGIALGHVGYYVSIARLGVAVSAGVLQLQPFGVAVASFVLFQEVLTVGQWTAGGVAVSGAILMLAVQRQLSRKQRIDTAPVAIAEGESGS